MQKGAAAKTMFVQVRRSLECSSSRRVLHPRAQVTYGIWLALADRAGIASLTRSVTVMEQNDDDDDDDSYVQRATCYYSY